MYWSDKDPLWTLEATLSFWSSIQWSKHKNVGVSVVYYLFTLWHRRHLYQTESIPIYKYKSNTKFRVLVMIKWENEKKLGTPSAEQTRCCFHMKSDETEHSCPGVASTTHNFSDVTLALATNLCQGLWKLSHSHGLLFNSSMYFAIRMTTLDLFNRIWRRNLCSLLMRQLVASETILLPPG